MVKSIELSLKRRDYEQAKDARTLYNAWTKRYVAGCPALASGHTDMRLPADRQNLSHLISYLCWTW